MMTFTGIFIDGPRRGAVLTAREDIVHFAQPHVPVRWLDDDPLLPTPVDYLTYYGRKMALFGRVYNVWTREETPRVEDLILTLVDSDPETVKAAEVYRPEDN